MSHFPVRAAWLLLRITLSARKDEGFAISNYYLYCALQEIPAIRKRMFTDCSSGENLSIRAAKIEVARSQ